MFFYHLFSLNAILKEVCRIARASWLRPSVIIFPLNWVTNKKFYQIGTRRPRKFITIGFSLRGLYISLEFNKGKDAIYTDCTIKYDGAN